MFTDSKALNKKSENVTNKYKIVTKRLYPHAKLAVQQKFGRYFDNHRRRIAQVHKMRNKFDRRFLNRSIDFCDTKPLLVDDQKLPIKMTKLNLPNKNLEFQEFINMKYDGNLKKNK